MSHPPETNEDGPRATKDRPSTISQPEDATQAGNDKTPFIPGWVDDLGLRPTPFRVWMHAWRRGETYSSAATIAKVCRLKRETVFQALAELEAAGLIVRVSRKGQTTLIKPVPPNGTGPKRDTSPQTGQLVFPETGHHPSPQTGHKGISPKGSPRKGSPTSADVAALADSIWKNSPPMARERSSRKELIDELSKQRVGMADEAAILAALELWKKSHSWTKEGGQYIRGIHLWVKYRKWETPPEITVQPLNLGGRKAVPLDGMREIDVGGRKPAGVMTAHLDPSKLRANRPSDDDEPKF